MRRQFNTREDERPIPSSNGEYNNSVPPYNQQYPNGYNQQGYYQPPNEYRNSYEGYQQPPQKPKKPFYKKWWFWLLIALGIFILFIAIGVAGSYSDNSDDNVNTEKASGHVTTSKERGNQAKKASSINNEKSDDNSIVVIAKKNYRPNFTDKSWNAANVTINSVNIFKVKPYVYDSVSKKKAEGMIVLNVTVKANRDLDSSYPDQGTVITDNGQQQDASLDAISGYTTNWGGEVANGASKTGDVIVPFEKMNDPSSIHSIRFKFHSSYKTDNAEDDNANHEYDITIKLA